MILIAELLTEILHRDSWFWYAVEIEEKQQEEEEGDHNWKNKGRRERKEALNLFKSALKEVSLFFLG